LGDSHALRILIQNILYFRGNIFDQDHAENSISVSDYNNTGLHYFCLDDTTENGTPTIEICQQNDDYERLLNVVKRRGGIAPPDW
jgi:hypothetical protein